MRPFLKTKGKGKEGRRESKKEKNGFSSENYTTVTSGLYMETDTLFQYLSSLKGTLASVGISEAEGSRLLSLP